MAIAAAVTMLMGMLVRVVVFVGMIMRMTVAMVAFAIIRKVYIKLYAINGTLLPAIGTECIAFKLELFELCLQCIKVHTKVDHCPQKHIATNATEDVEIKGLHVTQDNHMCPSLDEPNIFRASFIP